MFIELHVPVIFNKNNCSYPVSTTSVGKLPLHQLNALGANGTGFDRVHQYTIYITSPVVLI